MITSYYGNRLMDILYFANIWDCVWFFIFVYLKKIIRAALAEEEEIEGTGWGDVAEDIELWWINEMTNEHVRRVKYFWKKVIWSHYHIYSSIKL